jgi:hypothetical protein
MMSEIRGPLSGIGIPIVEAIREHQRLPPQQKSVAGVGFGASALAGWVYLGPDFVGGMLGVSLSDPLALEVWAGVGLVPLAWLLFTLRATRGQRDMVSAFGWLLFASAWAALLWWQMYPDPRDAPLIAFLLKGIYWVSLAGNLARVFAAAQPFGGGGSALRAVNRQLRRQNAPLRAANGRRRFFLLVRSANG